MKKEETNKKENLKTVGPGESAGLTAREQACVGKKYGDSCTWRADDGSLQTGICIYDKWGLTDGKLFCAKKDYKGENIDDALKSGEI